MRRSTILLVTVLLASASVDAAEYKACSESPELVGTCWNLRGRVSYFNGNPSIRIWPVGTNRMLGVRESDPPLLPPELQERLSWQSSVFSDLRVCPLSAQQRGHMQIVCVAAAKNSREGAK